MSRIEHIGNATLFLGDCRDILPTLGKVDAMFADPPFSIPHKFADQVDHRHGGKRTLSFAWDSEISATEVVERCRLGMKLATGSAFVFCGLRQATPLAEALSAEGFTDKMAAWVKQCPPPALPGNWWPSAFTLAVFGYRPGAWFGDKNPTRTNVFVADTYRAGIRADEKVAHPTQLWLPLAEKIIAAIAPPGGIVIDPFMGSGTSGVACHRLGRSFVGVERNPEYFDIACKRIDQAARQSDLFITGAA